MQVIIKINGCEYEADLNKPRPISIPLHDGYYQANAFFAPFLQMEPVVLGNFIGDTSKGGSVNFKNVMINPHGNGTHTECVGHIAKEQIYLTECLTIYTFLARLVSVYPTLLDNGDRIITRAHLETLVADTTGMEALILRTLPNSPDKTKKHYSGTNPTYMEKEAAAWLAENKILHLLIDLPSIDREEDGGVLAAHHSFWKYPEDTRRNATITEFVYVPDDIKDGIYLLQMQITSLQMDASPSMPVLYGIKKIDT